MNYNELIDRLEHEYGRSVSTCEVNELAGKEIAGSEFWLP